MTGNLFSGIFFTFYCHFNLLASLFVLSGYIPSSALNTVILVVFEHPSTFLAAVIYTVSSCSTNFAFPSHTTRSYSHFGAITLIIIHILILVPRCGSVRIASILPTCYLPFPITFAMCASQEQSFEISTPRYVYWSTIGSSSPPTSIRNLPGSPCLRYIQLLRIFLRSLSLSISYSSAFSICLCNPSGVLVSPRNHPQTSAPTQYLPPS